MKSKRFSLFIAFFSFSLFGILTCDEPVGIVFNPAESAIQSVDLSPTAGPEKSIPLIMDKPADKHAPEEANVYLNFENVSLSSVVNYLAERKKINIIPHKDLEAQKVSLSTRNPLTLTRAWEILLTLLEANNFSIISVDNLHRIVSNKDNGVEPLPYYSSQTTSPENLPDSDLAIRYIYFFKNIRTEIAQDILRTMLEGDKAVQPIKELQAVLLKEKCHNIKAAMKILTELDTGGIRESIRILPLKEADADTVQKLFSEIIGDNKDERLKFITADNTNEASYFSTSTKIIADSSRNTLILLGTQKNLDRITDFIYNNIDIPIGSANSRLHIKQLKYAKADVLKPLLENIIKAPAGQGSDKSSVVGQFKFFEDVIISADAGGGDDSRGSGNRLIVSANQDDWARLSNFIDLLDKPSPQVAFEVIIVDINLDAARSLGAQLQTKGEVGMGINRAQFNNLIDLSKTNQNQPSGGSNISSSTVTPSYNFMTLVDSLKTNSTFMTLGKGSDIWALLSSSISSTNFHIVSQPFLITNNFQECSMVIGETKRVPGALVTEKGEGVRQQQVEKSANTELKLTPQINYNGIVNLKVDLISNSFSSGLGTAAGPGSLRRSMNTRLSMATGEVLVLGGMTSSTHEINQSRTPLLSSIPLIGNLFRYTSKKKSENNLYVFIRPSIIKPKFEGSPDEYTQLKLDYAKYQLLKNDTYAQEKDPIQRWFFKPANHSIKETMSDAKNGIFRPLDNFTYGKHQPHSVDLKIDPAFQTAEAIEVTKKLKSRRRKVENA